MVFDRPCVRCLLLVVVVLAAVAAAPGQDRPVSSDGVTGAQAGSAAAGESDSPLVLPVSLERIRELLAVPQPLHESVLKRPTFKIEVEERHHIQELMSRLDFKDKPAPAPAGGLYGYETQRVMLSSLSTPLMQPYAAFSGGELLTLAFEGLLSKYLGWRAVDMVTAADRERAQAAAKAEVARAIVEYCAGLPDKGADVRMCNTPAP
jgi:hypothetical protein